MDDILDNGYDGDGLRQRLCHNNKEKDQDNQDDSFDKDKTEIIFSKNGFKKPLSKRTEAEDEESHHADNKSVKSMKQTLSADASPCHSWISNGSTTTDMFGEDEEEFEGEGGGDIDDYEYDPYTHEYVPRIRDPPPGEDSDDGLLVSREQRDASLSFVAQALLESARANQEKYEQQKQHEPKKSNNGGDSFTEKFFLSCWGTRKLREITEMPGYLQFNKHIHSGYRELQDFWGCVFSLGYLHNETFNILTHVAPIVYILCYWRTMFPWEEIRGNTFMNILGWSHIIASISPWAGSVIYHLFMSYHKGGEKFYQLLLQIDMFGIWITECFGALSNLSAASWCLSKDFQTAIMTAYGLAAVWGLQKALTAWTPVARRMCFAPVLISRILAIILRVSPWGGGDPNIMIHVILQDVLSISGGIIGVIRIPEKWFPGRLDLIFNSHHIMHILVVIAVCHMNAATNGDIKWIINNYSQSKCIQCIQH